ncbi:MAG: multidrug ABC transporter [Lachnospiraceae bacterium]
MNLYFGVYLISVTVASFSQILLKKSATKKYSSVIREYLNPWVITGYAMLFLSMFLTILAFRGMDYKNGPVIESLGYVMVLFLSRVFFGEKISGRKVVGTVCILAGIMVFYL